MPVLFLIFLTGILFCIKLAEANLAVILSHNTPSNMITLLVYLRSFVERLPPFDV